MPNSANQFVDGLQSLREAVSDFTPEYVELRAGVPAELMIEAARVWGHGKRGTATAGTRTQYGAQRKRHGAFTPCA